MIVLSAQFQDSGTFPSTPMHGYSCPSCGRPSGFVTEKALKNRQMGRVGEEHSSMGLKIPTVLDMNIEE